MNKIWIIAKKELGSFFDSLIAYVILILFLGGCGFFTWLYPMANVFLRGEADLSVFFEVAYIAIFILVPALTMRMVAEENRVGTIELLMTKAVSDWEIIIGKFTACLLLVVISLAFTIPYYVSVSMLGPVDHGAVIGGYLGLILIASAYIGIGLLASSITNSQIVAFLFAAIISLLFTFIFSSLAASFTGFFGNLFSFLSLNTHYASLSRGVIDSTAVIYFLSIMYTGLLLSKTMLSKRNWQH